MNQEPEPLWTAAEREDYVARVGRRGNAIIKTFDLLISKLDHAANMLAAYESTRSEAIEIRALLERLR